MASKLTSEESRAICGNSLLLEFEGFIKYIEGLNKGMQSASSLKAVVATDCIGEVLEYLTHLRTDIHKLFQQCEAILTENENLKSDNTRLKKVVESNDKELSKLEVKLAKIEADKRGKR